MKQFPSVFDLAKANLDDVMSLWSGLGYYARARNLYKTAVIIAEKHHGIFPITIDELERLPGIGRSTAGAILSLSQNICAPILDGNVKRVLSRYFLIEEDLSAVSAQRKLWQLADKLTPKKNAANYNQAMMDIGATICVRSNPLCNQCPVQKSCKAFLENKQNAVPFKKQKKSMPIKKTIMLIMQNSRGEILLEKKPPVGVWGGLWSFPEIDSCLGIKKEIKKRFNADIISMKEQASFRHTFSHYHLEISPVFFEVKLSEQSVHENHDLLWVDIQSAKNKGIPKPVSKILASSSRDLIAGSMKGLNSGFRGQAAE
jgi:A/G-specific adenine glycosylase